MKKVGIIILIVILISFTIALCNILTFAIQNKEWNWFMGFRDSSDIRKEEYIRKEENIDLTDIEKLKIELNTSDVNVFFTEESELKVIQYSYKELTSEQDKINNLVTDNINTQNKKDSVLNAVTSVSLNVLDNNISVTLYTQTGETDNELISKFKDEVSDSEMIAFEFSNRKTVNFVN